MQKPGIFDHFPEETVCKSWFFRVSAGTNLKWAFNDSSPNSKQFLIQKSKSNGLHIHQMNFRNLDYKWF